MTVSTGPAHIPGPGESHHARQVAESFGSDAERYDRARPRYPGRDLLDVGCGTGIVARQFQALGCRVVGVDPDAKMVECAAIDAAGGSFTMHYPTVAVTATRAGTA